VIRHGMLSNATSGFRFAVLADAPIPIAVRFRIGSFHSIEDAGRKS
jgi:hypothetical protein